MNDEDNNATLDAKYAPEIPCRWSSYCMYRLFIFFYLMSESSTVFAVGDMSHGPYYVLGTVHLLVVIFIGIPLIYSEICIAQFTNCSVISLWNYFPVFRGFGHGMIYLIFLRTIYLNVLSSWYLIYTFHGALNPPPWFSCEYFNTTNCMIKRINVSTFQHCIEAQEIYAEDCNMYTASYFFFESEIGSNNTQDNSSTCFYPWKPLIATLCINFTIFLLNLKNQKLLELSARFVIAYITIATFLLFCVTLSTRGSWNEARMWITINIPRVTQTMSKSFMTLGAGTGLVAYLSHDAGFRRPATRTAVITPLLATTMCMILALIIFSGIKNMSYFHGSEDYVLESGEGIVFQELASIGEILSYYNAEPFWGFLWFSTVLLCLFINIWISYNFLDDLVFKNVVSAKKHRKLFRLLIKSTTFVFALPFYCIDLFESLMDIVELMQTISIFFFSLSLYWFYGFERHAVDISFMIGVKASIFWKVTWVLNPILVMICVIAKIQAIIYQEDRAPSWSILLNENEVKIRIILMYVIGATYLIIFIGGTIFELVTYNFNSVQNLFEPTKNWGPKDTILYKSRQMFVPQIMTTEFLYRQVRIRGYKQKAQKKQTQTTKLSPSEIVTQWNPMMSN